MLRRGMDALGRQTNRQANGNQSSAVICLREEKKRQGKERKENPRVYLNPGHEEPSFKRREIPARGKKGSAYLNTGF